MPRMSESERAALPPHKTRIDAVRSKGGRGGGMTLAVLAALIPGKAQGEARGPVVSRAALTDPNRVQHFFAALEFDLGAHPTELTDAHESAAVRGAGWPTRPM